MAAKILLLAPLLLAACSATDDPAANRPNNAPSDSAVPSQSSAGTSKPADDHADPAPDSPAPPPDDTPAPPTSGDGCANVTSAGFQAWVNAMPGPNRRPTLIVTGAVETPTGGYRIKFTDVRVAESNPVQVTALLSATPPSGMATQAVMKHELRGTWPMSGPVGSVTIRCGSKTLARISPVETAQ